MQKEDIMTNENNPMLVKFERYLALNYSNEKTKTLYFKHAKFFLNKYDIAHGIESIELTQDMLDDYTIYLNSKRNTNPFYYGFIRAFHDSCDPDGELKFKTNKNRSRESKGRDEYDWLDEPEVRRLINESETYISLTVEILFETGLRKMELIGLDLNNREHSIDLEKRIIKGVGKGNKVFTSPISIKTTGRLREWLATCSDPKRPFMLFKSGGDPYKNQDYVFWFKLKKESDKLGIKLASGKSLHPHALRHSVLRWLRREKGWQIEELAKFGRHEDPKTTMIYSGATAEEVEKKLKEDVFDK